MNEYVNLDQTIYIVSNFSIVFSFYDHHICGKNMMHIYLEEIDTKEIVTLKIDTPCDSGLPSLLHDEMELILEKALSNTSNNNSSHNNFNTAICRCFNTLCPLTQDTINKHRINLQEDGWKYNELNELFPTFIPESKSIEYEKVEMNEEFGYRIIHDGSLMESSSNRGKFSKWSNEKKKLFGKFIKELFKENKESI